MREKEFKAWLEAGGRTAGTVSSQLSKVRKIEKHFGELDDLIESGKIEEIANILSKPEQAPEKLGAVAERRHLRQSLRYYREFAESKDLSTNISILQADQIRRYVIKTYVGPARQRGDEIVEMVSGDIQKEMGLKDALPAVCSALEAKAFSVQADVKLIERKSPIGSEKPSSTILYKFALEPLTQQKLNRKNLDILKSRFIDKFPDFEKEGSFAGSSTYHREEDDYKRALIDQASHIIQIEKNDKNVGEMMIALIAGTPQLPSNLIDWRAQKAIDKAREANPGVIETAVGKLLRNDDAIEAIPKFVDDIWNMLIGDLPSKPYAESRMLPTMLRALVEPKSVMAIRSTPTQNAYQILLGQSAFKFTPLTRQELQNVNNLAQRIFAIMGDEWGWEPRDLWDVQGFIWVTCQNKLGDKNMTDEDEMEIERMEKPTNLILYGPPGTGKTYETMGRAIKLCGKEPHKDRQELKQQYQQLCEAKQIEFVTFHQNFSYEEFVEGLRPHAEGTNIGFSLNPEAGIFRNLCSLADEARKSAVNGQSFSLDGKQVFKMSLGRAGLEDEIFEDAKENSYITLGWGGQIDWHGYDSYDAIYERWNQDFPNTHGSDSNIAQVNRFVVDMKIGDLVIISYGNKKVRAIARIEGDYEYNPTGVPDYNHRRSVKWLKHFDEPIDASILSHINFSQKSCYLINKDNLNREGLATLFPEETGDGISPKQFVLIIDEINRANVSKVFGELITLIEPDKRLGADNEITVQLPYSKKKFGVPSNLHIIGTMNTADRSIAQLDIALRRRFTFKELAPDTNVEAFQNAQMVTGINLSGVLNSINKRIEYFIDRDHRIGHAFFIGCKEKEDVDAAMRDKIIPLLQEYFFDDWNRMAAVLGERDKGGNFLDVTKIKDPMGEDKERKSWRVKSNFNNVDYNCVISGTVKSTEQDHVIETSET